MKHRRSFTAEFKLKVVEKDGNREAGRYFEVDEKAVRNWRKQRDVLKSMGRKRSNRHGKVKWPALEENLLRWVLDQRNARCSISTVKIRLRAKSMAEEMQIMNFKGRINWVYHFMRHKNLRVRSRTTMCQAVPDDVDEKKASFLQFTRKVIAEGKYSLKNIINVDEVPLTFDCPPNRTVDTCGVKTISITTTGQEKTHFTVMLACCHGSLVVKVTDSWLACHEFEHSTTEDRHAGEQCTLNMSRTQTSSHWCGVVVRRETSAGYYRLQIPKIAVSKTVSKCLKALKYVLPRDIYSQVFIKWYSSRNAPGPNDMDTRSELNVFLLSLLGLIGFDNDRIVLGDCIKNHSNVPAQVKKLKTHEKGCDDDWHFIMSLNNHKQSVEFKFLNEASIQHSPVEDVYLFNDSALLFPYIAHVLFAIHLVYEEKGTWGRRSNFEPYQSYNESDIVNFIEIQRIKWAGHIVKTGKDHTSKIVFNVQSISTRRKGRPNLRWIDGLEKDLLVLRTRNWRTLAGRRLAWKRLLEKAKTHPGLSCH
ncbi:anaphase-promoting complex subunit 1 [Trichonephila clavipes]|nr:anaphase-promoting complex subunit 1 [Trichonephila clavipes]